MRLGFDLRIMRYPPGGTAAYAHIALERMAAARPDEWQVIGLPGWPRLDQAASLPRPLRRATNLALDTGWLTLGAAVQTARQRLDAWFSPASMLPLMLPRPRVAIFHNLAFLVVPQHFDQGFVRVARQIHRLSAQRATRIVVPSAFLRDVVVERLGAAPERVVIVGWGLDHLPEPDAESGVEIGAPYALFIGQTQRHWNIDALLDAWQRGVPPDLKLVVAGAAGNHDTALRTRVEQEGLADRVLFTGLLPPPRLMALIRDARLFVDASLAEGFGKPVVESMLSGIPSAVSSSGALVEVTDGAALAFDPHDPDAIADAVSRLHTDEDLRRRLADEGRRVAGRYRWSASVEGYWRAVDDAVEEWRH